MESQNYEKVEGTGKDFEIGLKDKSSRYSLEKYYDWGEKVHSNWGVLLYDFVVDMWFF